MSLYSFPGVQRPPDSAAHYDLTPSLPPTPVGLDFPFEIDSVDQQYHGSRGSFSEIDAVRDFTQTGRRLNDEQLMDDYYSMDGVGTELCRVPKDEKWSTVTEERRPRLAPRGRQQNDSDASSPTRRDQLWGKRHNNAACTLEDCHRDRAKHQMAAQEVLHSTAQDRRGMPPTRLPPLVPKMEINEVPIGGVLTRSDWINYHELLESLDNLPNWADPNDPPRTKTYGDAVAVHEILGLNEESDVRRVNSPICLHYARDGFFSRKTMLGHRAPDLKQRQAEFGQIAKEYAQRHNGRIPTGKMMCDIADSILEQDRRQHEEKCMERLAALKGSSGGKRLSRAGNPLGQAGGRNPDDMTVSSGCKCTAQ